MSGAFSCCQCKVLRYRLCRPVSPLKPSVQRWLANEKVYHPADTQRHSSAKPVSPLKPSVQRMEASAYQSVPDEGSARGGSRGTTSNSTHPCRRSRSSVESFSSPRG